MAIALLIAGLWMAQFPEATLRRLHQLGIAIERFTDSFRWPGAPFLPPRRDPESLSDSRAARNAMRCFGIALAALALAGLFRTL